MTRRTSVLVFVLVLVLAVSAPLLLRAWLPQVATGSWASIQVDPESAAETMLEARDGAVAVLLDNERVLITGGSSPAGEPLATAELFDASGTFFAAAPMNVARMGHTATKLTNGRILVAGGTTAGGVDTQTVEEYDPDTNTWTLRGALQTARSGHTATLVQDGFVVMAGGATAGAPVDTIEMYDSKNGRVNAAGSLGTPRAGHAAAALGDGRVVIFGGFDGTSVLATTRIFDPETLAMTIGPAMPQRRAGLTAVTLIDGTVLIAGGTDGTEDLASLLVFDGAAFTSAGALAMPRLRPSAVLLPHNNSVLIFGGTWNGAAVQDAALFRSWSRTVVATGVPAGLRANAAAAPTPFDGVMLAAGGDSTGSAEIYGFATLKSDRDDYSPGDVVTLTGSGWIPGETVTFGLREAPAWHGARSWTTTADANGQIYDNQFSPEQHDLYVRFFLTATGSMSEVQITFTDANNCLWTGATSTAWETSANWTNCSGGVPLAADTALIPAGLTNYPTLSTATSIAKATVNSGGAGAEAVLTVAVGGALTVSGGDGSFTINANGRVVVSGGAVSSAGRLNNMNGVIRVVSGSFSLAAGAKNVESGTGNVLVEGGTFEAKDLKQAGAFDVSGGTGSVENILTSTFSLSSGIVNAKNLDTTGAAAISGGTLTLSSDFKPAGVTTITGGNVVVGNHVQSDATTMSAGVLKVTKDFKPATFVATGGLVQLTGVAGGGAFPLSTSAYVPAQAGTIAAASNVLTSTGTAVQNGDVIVIENEHMLVVAGGGTNSLTVVRGIDGTNTVVHTNKAITRIVTAYQFYDLQIDSTSDPGFDNDGVPIFVSHNWTNNSTLTSLTKNAVIFNGSSPQALGGTQPTTSVDVVMANPAGTTLSADLKVTNELTFLAGNLTTGANIVTSGANEGSGVVAGAGGATGWVVGNLKKFVHTNALTSAKAYQVGTASFYAPFMITPVTGFTATTNGTSALTVSAVAGEHPSVNTSGINSARNVNNYWTVVASGPGNVAAAGYKAKGEFDAGNVDAGSDTATFDVAKYLSAAWTTLTSPTRTGTSTEGTHAAGAALTASFGDFVIGAPTPTPTSTSVVSSGSPTVYGTLATFTATVTSGGAPVTEGTVKFYDGGASCASPGPQIGADQPVDGTGQAQVSASKLSVAGSPHTVRACFQATTNFAESGGSVSHSTTAKDLTITGVTANNKVYDGNNTATLDTGSAALATVEVGDTVTLNTGSATATFASVNVAAGITVTTTGFTISGADSTNYNLIQPTLTADITALHVTGSFTADNKTYDGNTSATVLTRSPGAVIGGDDVTLDGGTATFDTKDVGTGKTVTLTGATLVGADAGNYVLDGVSTTTANITAVTVSPTIVADDRPYDGTTNATYSSCTVSPVVGSEDVSCTGGTVSFDSKDIGTRTATATGLTLAGADAGNYTLNPTSASDDAEITALHVTGSFTADNKVYDGTTAATVLTRSPGAVIGGDAVSLTGGTATFDTATAGTGKTVTLTGASLTGGDAPNYILDGVSTTTADITQAPTTTTAANQTAPYSDTDQTVALTATVTGSVVNEGMVTFTVKDSGLATVGSAVFGNVVGGSASANFTLPGGTPVGAYAIEAHFSGATNHADSDATPATLTVTPSSIFSDVAGIDADFKKIDGFDVLFGKIKNSTLLSLKNTNPGTFHFRQTIVNTTGVALHEKNTTVNYDNGGTMTAILTIPALPGSVGTSLPASAQQYAIVDVSAFMTRGNKPVKLHPDDKTDDIMKNEMVSYATSAPGGNCSDAGVVWTAGQPADNTLVKCIRVEGIALPKKGKARIEVNLEFALKDTAGWDSNAQLMFRAGFLFKTMTTIVLDNTFPVASLAGKTYVGNNAVGLVGAGQKVTAIGGFVLDEFAEPIVGGATVRLFNTAGDVSACAVNTNVVAETTTLADGFYFIWNQGSNQSTGTNTLKDGIKYVVQVCGGGNQLALRTLENRLGKKEFDQEDFYIIFP